MSSPGEFGWTKVCADTLTDDGTTGSEGSHDSFERIAGPTPPVSEPPAATVGSGGETDVATVSPLREAFRLLENASQQCKSFSFTFHMKEDAPTPSTAQLSTVAAMPHDGRGNARGRYAAVGKEACNAALIIVVTLVCAVAFSYGASHLMAQAAAGGLKAGTLSDELDRVTQQLQARTEALERLQLQLQETNVRLATVREANAQLHSDVNQLSNENRELLMRESSCASARGNLQRWANQLEVDKYQLRKAMARCWC